jgi:ribonuclease Z
VPERLPNRGDMRAFVEWLGCGASDASASIVLHFEERRILFNCGEGTQRLCNEYKVRLGKLSHIFLTHIDAETCAGFLGLMLSLADAGHPGLELFAPKGTEKAIFVAKRFAGRPQYPLRIHEIDELETLDPVYQDMQLEIYALPWVVKEHLPRSLMTRIDQPKRHCGEQREEDATQMLGSVDLHRIFLTYVVRISDQKGRFLPEKAAALGIPRGPLYGKLQRGESILLDNDDREHPKTVHPADVMEPSTPGPLLVMLNCSSASLFALMNAPEGRQRFREWYRRLLSTETACGNRQICIFHFLGDEVLTDPMYPAWALDVFGADAYHAVSCETLSNQRIVYRGQAAMLERLKLVERNWFLEPWMEDAERVQQYLAVVPSAWQVAQPLLRFNIAPASTIGWEKPDPNSISNGRFSPKRKELRAPGETRDDDWTDTFSVLFLGTGSAMPSRYRNVSSILVDFVDHAIFLDAGEGTFGQMVRAMGVDKSKSLLLHRVRCIWISHMHADHHLGAGSLIALRTRLAKELPRAERLGTAIMPLLVLGPRLLGRWLETLAELEPLSYIFLSNSELLNSDTSPIAAYFPHALGMQLRTVRVDHCPDAYALILESALGNPARETEGAMKETDISNWKLVYSGDTLPFDAGLIAAAKGASLIIHEATFEDGKEDEALLRKHSTIGQALGTIGQMQPKQAVLTHFSQRYPKLPLIAREDTQQLLKANHCLLAWDLMRFPWLRKVSNPNGATGTPSLIDDPNCEALTAFHRRLVAHFARELEEANDPELSEDPVWIAREM